MSESELILPKMLTRTLDQLPAPFFIRDKSLRFIYANMALVKFVGLRSADAIIGRMDDEIPASLFDNPESAKHWQEQVKYVVNTQKRISLLEVHPGAVDSPYLSKKVPFYNENNQCVGMVGSIKYLEIFSANDYIRGRLPGSLLLEKPDELFTEKECEVIFLKLQGMTSKNIGQMLCKSSRTIENTLQRIYSKCGVSHFDDFSYFCEQRNLHRYLPQRFLDPKRFVFENDSHAW
ncbi:MAG: PAS domain-containing protein [Rouxiella aceris]|uniref:helix-turn-helix transcriptional regulator n=1 Tax=Rouxiella aceris TaxID=2703884 RepID=UPI002844252A|nr:PAS domain-containing protein [Rouxiella aceris]MDR3432430.1 PAS domain-containing protein [Rouxiella aceris]